MSNQKEPKTIQYWMLVLAGCFFVGVALAYLFGVTPETGLNEFKIWPSIIFCTGAILGVPYAIWRNMSRPKKDNITSS